MRTNPRGGAGTAIAVVLVVLFILFVLGWLWLSSDGVNLHIPWP